MPLQSVYRILFVLSLFFVGFNHYELLSFLGEYKRDTPMIFILIGFLVLCVEVLSTGKIHFPLRNILIQLLVLFVVWCVVSSLLNYPTIKENYFKRITGLNRFMRQMMSLLISMVIVLPFYWKAISVFSIKDMFKYVRGTFLASLVFACVYAIFDIGYNYFGFYPAYLILENVFDYLPFIKPHYHIQNRISIFAYEPPYLAIYLIGIAGWMFSYLLTAKSWLLRFFPSIAIIVLTFFSGSRTALIVIFIQLLLFVALLFKDNIFRREIKLSIAGMILVMVLSSFYMGDKLVHAVEERMERLNFADNLKTDISNKSRFGMQYASWQVYKENPIIGVGYGQQAYHNRDHFPIWSTKGNWEFIYMYQNKKEESFPPGYNLYTRILAELGTIGIVIFLTFSFLTIRISYRILKVSRVDRLQYALVLSIFVTLVGLLINWLQLDTFRSYLFWVNLLLMIRLIYIIKSNTLINNE